MTNDERRIQPTPLDVLHPLNWELVTSEQDIALMMKIAIKAGNLLYRAFPTQFTTFVKPDRSEYTPFDEQAEKIARTLIKEVYPQAAIMGEELSPNEDVTGKEFFAIDGIDGTTNFSRGIGPFNFTMARVVDGKTISGIVCNPIDGNIYYAKRGQGAYRNGERLYVKDRPFTESLLSFAPLLDVRKGKGIYEGEQVETVWRGMRQISQQSRRFMREFQSGGQELAWVATGQLDGYASSWTNPWDLSAGVLLIREAGGVATNILGETWEPSYWGVIAGSPTVHAEMLRILQPIFLSLAPQAFSASNS
jgi:myo-inositol-1(or 4)-monophosphatase